jgi:hypothetical protein
VPFVRPHALKRSYVLLPGTQVAETEAREPARWAIRRELDIDVFTTRLRTFCAFAGMMARDPSTTAAARTAATRIRWFQNFMRGA